MFNTYTVCILTRLTLLRTAIHRLAAICYCCPRQNVLHQNLSLYGNICRTIFKSSFTRSFVSNPLKDLPLALAHRGAFGILPFHSADISRDIHLSVPYRMNANGTVQMINFQSFLLFLPLSSETSHSMPTKLKSRLSIKNLSTHPSISPCKACIALKTKLFNFQSCQTKLKSLTLAYLTTVCHCAFTFS